MSRIQLAAAALTLVVGAVAAVAPLCVMPGCGMYSPRAQASAHGCCDLPNGIRMACDDGTTAFAGSECGGERPSAIPAAAERPAPALPDANVVEPVVTALVVGQVVEVASVQPPPPDPLAGTSPIRI